MADIRINALATTATSSASDDYLAIDGSANGTRKLSAYSPSFGGNATVGGFVSIGSATGFQTTTYTANSRNGIWSFGNASTYGLSYFQGSAGLSSIDTIGFHFGTATAAGSAFAVTSLGDGILSRNLTVTGAYATLGTGTANTGAATQYLGASTSKNWLVGNRYNLTGLEFTPSTANGGSTFSVPAMAIHDSGNVLLGTVIDSGNGKLQLATHTTSAGGIGFGTDTALYRSGVGEFVFRNVSTGSTLLYLVESGTTTAVYGTSSSVLYAGTKTANSFVLQTNNTTALILDSSQTAYFAGATYANGVTVNSGYDLKLGRAYTAGAPAATGYVTIQDSSGTTYKVLVST